MRHFIYLRMNICTDFHNDKSFSKCTRSKDALHCAHVHASVRPCYSHYTCHWSPTKEVYPRWHFHVPEWNTSWRVHQRGTPPHLRQIMRALHEFTNGSGRHCRYAGLSCWQCIIRIVGAKCPTVPNEHVGEEWGSDQWYLHRCNGYVATRRTWHDPVRNDNNNDAGNGVHIFSADLLRKDRRSRAQTTPHFCSIGQPECKYRHQCLCIGTNFHTDFHSPLRAARSSHP